MVVDSSALIAILENETEAEQFLSAIEGAPRCMASAVTIYETGIVVLTRRGIDSVAEVASFIEELGIEIVPFADPYVTSAWEAYARYGKGVDPKARLNLGDCAAYALAKIQGMPLLFKGADFSHTDLTQAV